MSLSVSTYPKLRTSVQHILAEGRSRAARAVEQEKVAAYWQVGKVIDEHLHLNQERVGYGGRVILRLAEDTGIGRQRLYEMLRFHRQFDFVRTSGQLGWSHYVELLGLKSVDAREFYADRAEAERWSVRELKDQVRSGAFERALAGREADSRQPVPIRGRLFTYGVYEIEEGDPVLDLGFCFEERLTGGMIPGLAEGSLVCTEAAPGSGAGYRLVPFGGDARARYTYRAEVLRVVDGDTLRVRVDLGFNASVRHTIRLRAIDAPEMRSAGGAASRAFVQRALSAVAFVVVRTYWRGRYGRYLADVFYMPGEPDAQAVADRGTYLNGELVSSGRAKTLDG